VEAAASAAEPTRALRASVIRNGLAIGIATGAYGLSFGALATASGLSVWQTVALSTLMFTGGSQFAFVGVVAAGGSPLAAAASATLLGTRNALYGPALIPLLRPRRTIKPLMAHVVIDESAAMALTAPASALARTGFWVSGLGVLFFWNLATALGALGAHLLPDPSRLGLDAVAPAAFIALLAPRLGSVQGRTAAALGAVAALAATPVMPAGTAVLAAATATLLYAFITIRRTREVS
jgi:predicted branched-subunit amino acid permease